MTVEGDLALIIFIADKVQVNGDIKLSSISLSINQSIITYKFLFVICIFDPLLYNAQLQVFNSTLFVKSLSLNDAALYTAEANINIL